MNNYYKKNLILLLILAAAASLIITSCSEDDDNGTDPTDDFPKAKFAVIADPHVYDPSLGTEGEAFQTYIAHDRKLIAESNAIFNKTVDMIKLKELDFVIVAGDLTKDGTKTSSQLVAQGLAEMEASGKKVFVCPGNHDVANPLAQGYNASGAYNVDAVSREDFKQIFADFGFNEAYEQDAASLSYIAEPVEGIWVMSLDVCKYDENPPAGQGHSVTGGRIKPETLIWVESKLDEAKAKGKFVIGFMHHNLLEHFPSQKMLFDEYIIDDFQNLSSIFSSKGMKLIFTGHHHAHDIALFENNTDETFIFDLQTGSTVTWTCPLRFCELTSGEKLIITTELINDVIWDIGSFSDFQAYAYDYLSNGLGNVVIGYLMMEPFSLDQAEATQLSAVITPALIDYYHGDEPDLYDAEMQGMIAMIKGMGGEAAMLAALIEANYADPTPDINVTIDLKTGSITKR